MFLGAFQFDGLLSEMVPAYDRLMRTHPPDALALHICFRRPGGITKYDACPAKQEFDQTTNEQCQAAVGAAGLPFSRVERLGELYATRVGEPVGQ